MKTYQHSNGRVEARKPDGQFRAWTGDDFGIGVCPECNTVTVQPDKPKELESGMIDPFLFNRWRKARVCQAKGVCDLLRQRGFGGDGKVFPVRTWTAPLSTQTRKEGGGASDNNNSNARPVGAAEEVQPLSQPPGETGTRADPLRIKLINLLHQYGDPNSETEFKDGEKIDEMVIRLVRERDEARTALSSAQAENRELREKGTPKLAWRCFDAQMAEYELFEKVNEILGGTEENSALTDVYVDDYDGSAEVIRRPELPRLTREQANAILDLGFSRIFESFGEPKGVYWTREVQSECNSREPRKGGLDVIPLRRELTRLRTALSSAQADKERLDWLEKWVSQCGEVEIAHNDHDGRRFDRNGYTLLIYRHFERGGIDETLRAAIDAGMKGEGK